MQHRGVLKHCDRRERGRDSDHEVRTAGGCNPAAHAQGGGAGVGRGELVAGSVLHQLARKRCVSGSGAGQDGCAAGAEVAPARVAQPGAQAAGHARARAEHLRRPPAVCAPWVFCVSRPDRSAAAISYSQIFRQLGCAPYAVAQQLRYGTELWLPACSSTIQTALQPGARRQPQRSALIKTLDQQKLCVQAHCSGDNRPSCAV
jgi:hypothetical protein